MRLLLEPSFPATQAVTIRTPFLDTERWTQSNATDQQLVDAAAATGSAAVVFLGRHALGRREVLLQAQRIQVSVVATEAANPLDAIDYLHDNLGTIRRELSSKAEALLVQRGRVIRFTLAELLAPGAETRPPA